MSNSLVAGLVLLGALGGVLVWWVGAQAGSAAQRSWRAITRTGQVSFASLVAGAVIAGLQWTVLTRLGALSMPALMLVFGIPAFLAGITVARMLTVSALIRTTRRRGARR